ncbi:MAG: hypothetical protein QM635_11255 [Microbacteriaceae bacterium]
MDPLTFLPPALAVAFFLVAGIVCWSYRDVYHRHSDRTAHTEASNGHADTPSGH